MRAEARPRTLAFSFDGTRFTRDESISNVLKLHILMGGGLEGAAPTSTPAGNPQRILEAWFPGVHSDVGGGYWLDGLSDIALAFMMRECRRALGPDVRMDTGTLESLRALLHNRSDALPGIEVDDLLVHPMVHGALHSHSGIMVKVGKEAPRQVCVRIDDHPSSDPSDAPIVHHSVDERFARVSGYRPNALRGLRFRLLLPDGSVSDTPIDGIAGLLENELAGKYSEMS